MLVAGSYKGPLIGLWYKLTIIIACFIEQGLASTTYKLVTTNISGSYFKEKYDHG